MRHLNQLTGALALLFLSAVGMLLCPTPARADLLTQHVELLAAPKDVADDPPLPELSASERTYLVKLARTALMHTARTGKRYEPTDVPASLRSKDYITYVACRLSGRLVDSIAGEGQDIAGNVVRAAEVLGKSVNLGADAADGAKDAAIELNIIGPGQRLQWTTLENVSSMLSPGVHGVALRVKPTPPRNASPAEIARLKDVTLAFKPTVGATQGLSSELLLQKLIEKAGWTIPQVVANRKRITFYRFRGIHLLEWPVPAGYVELFRCAELVTPEQVTGARVTERIDSIGRFMLYRQLKNGQFSYSYSPITNQYLKEDNAARQAGAAWAVSRLARATGEPIYQPAALKAIGSMRIHYLDEARTAACVAHPADKNQGLGTTALVLLAVVDLPDNQPLAGLRDKLVAGILRQQRPDGSFKVYFNNVEDDGNREYYPGEALLALARVYQDTRDPKLLAAIEKAFPVYRAHFEGKPTRSFCPWQTQAWAILHDLTGKQDYADFVFAMTDYVLSFQVTEHSPQTYPDMVGACVDDEGYGGVGTASFLEGVGPALRVARKTGDKVRASKYERSLRAGLRFLDQLTFKAPDAFYCLVPKDVVGGVRLSPLAPDIRIDNCQHAVCALMAVREELFPESVPRPTSQPALPK